MFFINQVFSGKRQVEASTVLSGEIRLISLPSSSSLLKLVPTGAVVAPKDECLVSTTVSVRTSQEGETGRAL